MKTLRISDDIHRKLTATVGTLMAQTGKMQTYQDAIEAMLNRSVILPPELLAEIENFIETNKHLGYTTREELIRNAIRFRLTLFKREYELVEIPREQYEKLNEAIKQVNMPYHSVKEFITVHVADALQKCAEQKRSQKRH
jgi:Arc/MetJ-type ribon-helix-helix transcriptional regulator